MVEISVTAEISDEKINFGGRTWKGLFDSVFRIFTQGHFRLVLASDLVKKTCQTEVVVVSEKIVRIYRIRSTSWIHFLKIEKNKTISKFFILFCDFWNFKVDYMAACRDVNWQPVAAQVRNVLWNSCLARQEKQIITSNFCFCPPA